MWQLCCDVSVPYPLFLSSKLLIPIRPQSKPLNSVLSMHAMSFRKVRLPAFSNVRVKVPLLFSEIFGWSDQIVSDEIVGEANYDGLARGNEGDCERKKQNKAELHGTEW
uniref:Uncharacterized protein n=2 Tax=Cacopsylla melanoneura TaxID=428564 RepID=A0A8D8VPQ4_9HEMI